MISFYNLLRVILLLYLGIFTYILYQLLFYHQKRFLFIKTILFFFGLAAILIYASNKYHIALFHVYLLFYLLGIWAGKKVFSKDIRKRNIEFKTILDPIKKYFYKFLKLISIPPFFSILKTKRKERKYYRLHPHLKPKSPYDLF